MTTHKIRQSIFIEELILPARSTSIVFTLGHDRKFHNSHALQKYVKIGNKTSAAFDVLSEMVGYLIDYHNRGNGFNLLHFMQLVRQIVEHTCLLTRRSIMKYAGVRAAKNSGRSHLTVGARLCLPYLGKLTAVATAAELWRAYTYSASGESWSFAVFLQREVNRLCNLHEDPHFILYISVVVEQL